MNIKHNAQRYTLDERIKHSTKHHIYGKPMLNLSKPLFLGTHLRKIYLNGGNKINNL